MRMALLGPFAADSCTVREAHLRSAHTTGGWTAGDLTWLTEVRGCEDTTSAPSITILHCVFICRQFL
ncbi:hypothetical protein BD413DRAFT_314319 [Trametes elegans]|nr:hypothetical protein BD413DRAFT_314319 [Trametes elegans]